MKASSCKPIAMLHYPVVTWRAASRKLQAPSLTVTEGYYRINLERRNNMDNNNHDADNDYLCSKQMERIANAMEEILRLVKKDMEPRTKEKD